ncbi:MAG: hypothetical protein KDA84_01765, partial [Planctomycetaceae bacterium]|nr:hypothetical protein [Planctomycetaceae bacterium]
MPKQYFDNRGNRVALGAELGVGGEGAVFEIAGRPDWVAKIYHRTVPADKAAKLATMLKEAS